MPEAKADTAFAGRTAGLRRPLASRREDPVGRDPIGYRNGPTSVMPETTGQKRTVWEALPDDVTASIERLLGSRVINAVSQPGGFSEGLAARLHLASGERVFVKAASSRMVPSVADFHRREVLISQRLPPEVPAPRLLRAYDDGDWVALVFEEIPGRLPGQPWQREELDAVLAVLTDLARILTPSPVDRSIVNRPRLGGWPSIAGDAGVIKKVEALSPWAVDHLDDLVALEEQAAPVSGGDTLQHGDLYPFNIMLAGDRVFVVDWPHAWIGPNYCDAVTLMSGTSLSGIDPQPLADSHPLTRALDPTQINTILALHAGFLLRIAASSGPSADRNLVGMMVALGLASLRWLGSRLSNT